MRINFSYPEGNFIDAEVNILCFYL